MNFILLIIIVHHSIYLNMGNEIRKEVAITKELVDKYNIKIYFVMETCNDLIKSMILTDQFQ